MTRPRRLLATAAAVASTMASCFHTHHVAKPEREEAEGTGRKEERGGGPEATKTRVPPRAGHPAVSATPEGFMQPGSVRRIQEALRSRGLLEGRPSGQLDEATSAALRRFQQSQELAATGAPDRETLHRLGLDPQEIYRTVPQGAEPRPSR